MVTKFVPAPADSGGKQRSLAVLKTLAAAGDVTLCAIDDGTADLAAIRELGVDVRAVPRPSAATRALGIARTGSISAGRFWSRSLLDAVRGAVDPPPDVLLVVYSQLAPYARHLPARHRILDLQNIESALFRSYAESPTSPLRRVAARFEERALRRIERRAATDFDTVVVVTDADAARLPAMPRRLLVCANGMTERRVLPMGDEPVVAFVGLLGWRPNADAALWLVNEVWPRVRAAVPGAELLLVGRDPSPGVLAAARDDIVVTGTVPDVEPYLARARVTAAPLLAGGGSRLKILESLGSGRPAVATTIGAEGLVDLVGHGLSVADSPDAFADALIARLRDRELAADEGRRGAVEVRGRYGWERTLLPLAEELRRCDGTHG
jgi:glycosyltransferase involved in cell wall biosynthesis